VKTSDVSQISSEWSSTEAIRALIPEPVHPAADKPPLWPLQKLLTAAAELKHIGQLVEPIQRLKETGEIIDGRHRRMMCLVAKIPPKFQNIELPKGLTAAEYVELRNDLRRQLTLDQLAAIAAFRYNKMRAEGKLRRSINLRHASKILDVEKIPDRRQGNSLTFLSNLFGVNARYIQQATSVLDADPELFNQLKAGKIRLKDARLAIGLIQRERPAPKPSATDDPSYRERLQKLVSAVLRLNSIKPTKLKVTIRKVVALAARTNEALESH